MENYASSVIMAVCLLFSYMSQINCECFWCVPHTGAADSEIAVALKFACDSGANCTLIQPGQPCYKHGDLKATATYAMTDYWTKVKHKGGDCYFNGTASITNKDPSFEGCTIPENCDDPPTLKETQPTD